MKRALDRNRWVHLAAEGRFGTSKITLEFFGENQGFLSGFADLAIEVNATIVTVLAVGNEDEVMGLKIGEPLIPRPHADREEQKFELVGGYLARLEKQILADPGNVSRPI